MSATHDIPRLTYTINEAASMLGLSRGTIYELNRRGELPFIKILSRTLIKSEDLYAMRDGKRAA